MHSPNQEHVGVGKGAKVSGWYLIALGHPRMFPHVPTGVAKETAGQIRGQEGECDRAHCCGRPNYEATTGGRTTGGTTLPAQLPNTQGYDRREPGHKLRCATCSFCTISISGSGTWRHRHRCWPVYSCYHARCSSSRRRAAHKMTIDWTKPFGDPSAREQSAKAIVKDGNVDV